VKAGEIIRVRTTGGGGWGDPFDRPTHEVARDVRWGKVSVAGARDDYGVVLTGSAGAAVLVDEAATEALRAAKRAERDYGVVVRGTPDSPELDETASARLREQRLADAGEQPFFDRGPGYATLAEGAGAADVDWL
jgi:N-methylhydantoinase B